MKSLLPESKTSLKELLHEIRRIEEHREILTERKIKAIHRNLKKQLNAYVAEEYIKYSDADGRFFMSYLDGQNKKAKFLQEIAENVNYFSPQLKNEILELADKTYSKSYTRMVEAVKEAEKSGRLAEVTKDIDVQPEVLAEAVNNNISKLTLPSVLEKYRNEIIFDIQQTLVVGLMLGDRYDQMAKRISERVDVSESKAKNIVRTESHRNIENGFMDCAEHIQKGMDGSDYIYAATWRTMQDERVRPQQRRKTKSGWKTYYSKNGANHIVMEGKTVKVGDMFTLNDGVKTKNPSRSGYARHDCNCRCFLEYNLMTIEEFEQATGKAVNMASVHGSVKELMNKNGIADCNLERTTDNQRFSNAIDAARKANPHGGAVDPVSPEQAAEYKCFLAKNNMAGVAVKPDGDITAVFKNSDWQQRGAVNDLIITARENGGVKMDCYGVGLVNKYEQCGYVPVAKVKFNPDFVDDEWLLKTQPDVYFLMKNTDDIEDVIEKNARKAYKLSTQEELDKLPVFGDVDIDGETIWGYDRAWAYRDDLLARQTAGQVIDDATKHYAYSVAAEPKITADLKKAVEKTGGQLTGLDFRLKTEKSYARKVEKEIIDINKAAQKRGIAYSATQADAVSNMRDVVRYTSLSSKETLVDDFRSIISGLEADGYKLVRVKNTFKPDAPYKGINCILQDASGYNFELQFHTPQSFELKNGILHELYEKERLVTTPPAEKIALQKQMKEISDSIVFPDNVDEIKSFNDLVDILDKIEK